MSVEARHAARPEMEERLVRVSKFLSLGLRHRPEKIGLKLDGGGWVEVGELLRATNASGFLLTLGELFEVVEHSDKRRFALSEEGGRIRASQGHTVEVELGYAARRPPALLFHGTAERFLDSKREAGLSRGDRHHVHLSAAAETARLVGARRGRAVVLEVEAGRMWEAGLLFLPFRQRRVADRTRAGVLHQISVLKRCPIT